MGVVAVRHLFWVQFAMARRNQKGRAEPGLSNMSHRSSDHTVIYMPL